MAEVALQDIQVDPLFTPEALKIKKHIEHDKAKVEKYEAIITDLHFHEFIKVWDHNNSYYLVENFELLSAFQQVYKKDPDKKIKCLLIKDAEKKEVKDLAIRLRNISPSDSNTGRLLNIHTLIELGCTKQKIKELYGVQKSHSAEGKKLQRDIRMVNHHAILNRVLGLDNDWKKKTSSAITAVAMPKIHQATLPYTLADKILSTLPDEPQKIAEFDALYEEYINSLEKSHIYEEDQTKPVFQRRNYSKDKVLKIAAMVARGNLKQTAKVISISGDDDKNWSIKFNEQTYDLEVPQIKVNLANKQDSNLKKIVDLKYKVEHLSYSLESYIKRFQPVEHGSPQRLKNAAIEPPIETSGNMSNFVDRNYFEYIRRHRLLYYCNRQKLLQSIDLKAHQVGFDDYAPDTLSSYPNCYEKFRKWYDNYFAEYVNLHLGGAKERHHHFEIYNHIMQFLTNHSSNQGSVHFRDFILNLFRYVFSQIDNDAEHRKKQNEILLKTDLKQKYFHWNKLINGLKDKGYSDKDARDWANQFMKDALDASYEMAEDLFSADRNKVLAQTHELQKTFTWFVENVGKPEGVKKKKKA